MPAKRCFKCGKTKNLGEFYKHKQMADGHLNKCKDCTKLDVAKHREENLERIREYDRKRGSRQSPEYLREYRARFPRKHKATNMVNNAIKCGKLFREPCEVCGGGRRIEAHHDDYAKPLNIRWLCSVHHKQWHAEHGEAPNGT